MIECKDFDPNPHTYLTSMNIISVIALPVNLFTIFCILCKSTKAMSAFKWYLLLYQITSTIFDFIYSTITIPVIFFSLPMGYTGSWIAERFSVTVHTTLLMVVPSFPCVAACIFSLFAYRIHLIIPHNHILKRSENGKLRKHKFFQLIRCHLLLSYQDMFMPVLPSSCYILYQQLLG